MMVNCPRCKTDYEARYKESPQSCPACGWQIIGWKKMKDRAIDKPMFQFNENAIMNVDEHHLHYCSVCNEADHYYFVFEGKDICLMCLLKSK